MVCFPTFHPEMDTPLLINRELMKVRGQHDFGCLFAFPKGFPLDFHPSYLPVTMSQYGVNMFRKMVNIKVPHISPRSGHPLLTNRGLMKIWGQHFQETRTDLGPVLECVQHCLLHFESLVKSNMYPKSTPANGPPSPRAQSLPSHLPPPSEHAHSLRGHQLAVDATQHCQQRLAEPSEPSHPPVGVEASAPSRKRRVFFFWRASPSRGVSFWRAASF